MCHAARIDVPQKARHAIGPHHHLATHAALGMDRHAFTHIGGLCIGDLGVAALITAAHPSLPARARAGGINHGVIKQTHTLAGEAHAPTQTATAAGTQHAVTQNRRGGRGGLRGQRIAPASAFHPDAPAARRAAGIEHRVIDRHIARRGQINAAASACLSTRIQLTRQHDLGRAFNAHRAALRRTARIHAARGGLHKLRRLHRNTPAVPHLDGAGIDHLGRTQAHLPGGAAVGARIGADLACVLNPIGGLKHNLAAAHRHAGGFKPAAVFHHAALQPIQRLGRQNDHAAGRHHRALVLHQRTNF